MTVPVRPASILPMVASPPLAAEPIVKVAAPPLASVTDLMSRPSSSVTLRAAAAAVSVALNPVDLARMLATFEALTVRSRGAVTSAVALPVELRTSPAVAESVMSRWDVRALSINRLPAVAMSVMSRLLPGPCGRIGPVMVRLGAVKEIDPSEVEAASTVRSAAELKTMSPVSVRLIATTW